MKIKDVSIGEVKFKIASLTVDQYEAMIGDGVTVKGKEFIRQHMCPVVAASLENAAQGNGKWFTDQSTTEAIPQWTATRVGYELDFGELELLYNEIVKFSGLKTATAMETAPPKGEVEAATRLQ